MPSFGFQHPQTTQATRTYHLWQGSAIAALVVGGIVWGLILWSVFRYRKKSDAIPKQTSYAPILEIIYTGVPILIVIGLFYFTLGVESKVDYVKPHPAVSLTVTAYQWGWRFVYGGKNVVVNTTSYAHPPVAELPVGQTVGVKLVSLDVIHSFYVPAFLFKRQAIPGIINEFDFRIKNAGLYPGQCAEICGLRHSEMRFVIKAVSPSTFNHWLTTMRGKAVA